MGCRHLRMTLLLLITLPCLPCQRETAWCLELVTAPCRGGAHQQIS